MSFLNLKLIEPILKALNNEGYTTPTPIQERSIPIILNRRDLLGCAQTGTGKTAAFAIPILQILSENAKQGSEQPNNIPAGNNPAPVRANPIIKNSAQGPATRPLRSAASFPIRALILTPTRELAIQIGESFAAYGKFLPLKHLVIFGGVPQHSQVQALQRGVDILVATPGRLLDLIDQRYISLRDIQLFVLDEADRMLDMGFVHDVKKVIKQLPTQRQTLFFSATMPPEIQNLAGSILSNPEKVEVTPVSSTAETIQQSLYFVGKTDKRSLLLHILKDGSIETALVFARTKHGADKIAQGLSRAGIGAEAIHGNKSQNARQRALQNFKSRQTRILVATDIAARGIDIDELTHVINFELPNVPETYVHRIGRTGRAGASGIAISFCDEEEREYLRDIQKLIARNIPVVEDHPFGQPTQFFQQRQPASGNGGNIRNGGNNRNGSNNRNSGNNRNSNNGNNRNSGNNRNIPSKAVSDGQQNDNGGSRRNPVPGGIQKKARPSNPAQAVPGLADQQPVSTPPQQPVVAKTEAVKKPVILKPEQQPSVVARPAVVHNKPVAGHTRTHHAEKDTQKEENSVFPYKVNQSAGDERL